MFCLPGFCLSLDCWLCLLVWVFVVRLVLVCCTLLLVFEFACDFGVSSGFRFSAVLGFGFWVCGISVF